MTKTLRFWSTRGLIHINKEVEGYSKITPASRGKTEPVLKIPSGTPKGWKRLTAIYDDEYEDETKEVYLSSIRRTLVYYGTKVWINTPCVIYDEDKGTVLLKADIFAHNRRVPNGYGKFYINKKCVSDEPLGVVNGYVESEVKVTPELRLDENGGVYSFKYGLNEPLQLSPDNGYGKIFFNKTPAGKTKLTVEVVPIIMNQGETQKLEARVYHSNYEKYSKYIRYPTDIPSGGKIEFYVDGDYVGEAGIVDSGFAQIEFNPDNPVNEKIKKVNIGTHNITAKYIPTTELEALYEETFGCGTLFVGDDTNKPTITPSSKLCSYIGNEDKEIAFTSKETLNGQIQLYLDGDIVRLTDTTKPDYELEVKNTKTFTLHFDTLGKVSDEGKHWLYGGNHNLILKYSVNDYSTFPDGKNYPMEYYYYLDYFYLQIPVIIELVGEPDNYTLPNPDGNQEFVGNNIYYINEKGDYKWYSPNNEREPSTVIGNKIQVRIKRADNEKSIVQGGKVKLTFGTRTENNDKEETINNARG